MSTQALGFCAVAGSDASRGVAATGLTLGSVPLTGRVGLAMFSAGWLLSPMGWVSVEDGSSIAVGCAPSSFGHGSGCWPERSVHPLSRVGCLGASVLRCANPVAV